VVRSTSRSRVLAAGLAAVAAAGLVAGCTGGPTSPSTDAVVGAPATSSSSSSSSSSPAAQPAEVSVTPADESTKVLPSTPVVVRATTGTLKKVTVTDAEGEALEGTLDASGTWTATSRPRPGTAYTVEVVAAGSDGAPQTTTSSFTTLTPKVTATYGIVYDGETVGVGMPVSIQFDSAVTTAAMRAEVEKRVRVTTSPKQAGAWGWLDNRQLMWRPQAYWQPGTKVTVDAPLTGVQTGPGKWVANDASGSFTVGSAMISTVDIKNHRMTVTKDGKVLRTIPISAGRPGPTTETRSGTKVIIRKEGDVTMDSATIGIEKGQPGYYKIETQSALRVTWTGEYLHSAPWSVGSQGSANVSHGCVNMAPSAAAWMYSVSKAGDIVTFTGSGRQFLPAEGIGVWQYSWPTWKAQSALA
jgi:lipoprotein-anchoring transpeptidase ErfK/SrfK